MNLIPSIAEANERRLRPRKLDEITKTDREFVYSRGGHGLIPKGEVTIVHGPPGAGKSVFCSWSCVHLTGKALYVSTEQHTEAVASMLRKQTADDASHVEVIGNDTDLVFPRDIGELQEVVTENAIELMVLDSLAASYDSTYNANDYKQSVDAMKPLARLVNNTGCTTLVVMHDNKMGVEGIGAVSGSNGAVAQSRAALQFLASPEVGHGRMFHTRSSYGARAAYPFPYQLSDGTFTWG
jgi:predicted ATP-dependent serine protease